MTPITEFTREAMYETLFWFAKRSRRGRSTVVSVTRVPREGVPRESIVTIVIRDSRPA